MMKTVQPRRPCGALGAKNVSNVLHREQVRTSNSRAGSQYDVDRKYSGGSTVLGSTQAEYRKCRNCGNEFGAPSGYGVNCSRRCAEESLGEDARDYAVERAADADADAEAQPEPDVEDEAAL